MRESFNSYYTIHMRTNQSTVKIIIEKINWFFEYRTIWVIIIIFASSILSKVFIAPYMGAVNFPFSDEHLYIELAKSIYYHHNLVSHTFPNILIYNEFLYPLVLSPLYFFYSPERIIAIFRIFGILIMSSAVFPAFKLGFSVLNDKKQALLISLLAILIPEMALSLSVIQEVVYYPLFLLAMYLIYQKIDGKKISPVVLGIIFFLLWTCKAIGITVFAGYIFYLILELTFINKFNNYKPTILHILIIMLIIFGLREVSSFVIRYLNYGNLESVRDFYTDVLINRVRTVQNTFISDFPNGILHYFFYTIMAFMIFPVILPIDNFNNYSISDRKFLLFLSECFLITVAAVVVLIYMDEGGAAREIQRVHYRYLFPLLIPLLILLLKLDYTKIKFKQFGFLCTSFLVLYYLLFQPKFTFGSIIDSKSLLLTETINNIILNGSNILVLTISIFSIGLGYFLYRRSTDRISKKLLFGSIITVLTINHAFAIYKTYQHYTVTTNSITRQEEYTSISKLVNSSPGTPIVMLPPGDWWVDSLYTTQSMKDFVQIQYLDNVLEYSYNPKFHPNFIITPKDLFLGSKMHGAEYIETGLTLFDIYKIVNSSSGKILFDYRLQNMYSDAWLMDNAKLIIRGVGNENHVEVSLNLLTSSYAGKIIADMIDSTGKSTSIKVSPSGTQINILVNKNPNEPNFELRLRAEGFFIPAEMTTVFGPNNDTRKLTYTVTNIEIDK